MSFLQAHKHHTVIGIQHCAHGHLARMCLRVLWDRFDQAISNR